MSDTKKCLNCGDIMRGRADKKFCSDNCRSIYNNAQNSELNKIIRSENQILKRNRKILATLNTRGKTKIKRSQLIDKGFDFNRMTRMYTTKKGHVYFYCYEYGYLNLENDEVLLVRSQID